MAAVTRPIPLRRRPRLRAELSQLLFAAAGAGLGLVLPRITGGPQVSGPHANELLIGLGFSVLGVTAVIFSLLFLVVQWAHTSFTPRLTLFGNAPFVWRTFSFAIGLVVFCLTAALVIGTSTRVSTAVPGAAVVLLLVLLALLRTLQLKALASIQLAPVLHVVTERGRLVMDALRSAASGAAAPVPAAALPPLRSTVSWPRPMTILQQVDMERLLATARAAHAVVVLRAIPGTTLSFGVPVADIHTATELTADPAPAVLAALVTGAERTFDQDPLFAFRLLADIVLRALSPAVNDPATAVQGLDCLEDLLTGPAGLPAGPLHVADPDGHVRVVVELPGRDEYLHTALDDVVSASAHAPMVLLRLRTLLLHLAAGQPADREDLVQRRLAWAEQELARRYPTLWDEARP
ncbi:DUF2254 family protein [Streptomyces sp. NBC_01006]|uniref:DUF2254 family protein n=1 Tax=Streptomyces sp. NBC_01006 TaxID=2903716 RepID=UPI003870E2B7|nr:DUF2254 domain-containing protein [Streptomyces sp. NBC_01006]